MNYINTLMAQILMVIAMLYLDEGQAWLDNSYGINPIIAGAVALSCVVLPYALTAWLHNRNTMQGDAIEELDELLDKYRDTIDEQNREREQLVTTHDWERLHQAHEGRVAFTNPPK